MYPARWPAFLRLAPLVVLGGACSDDGAGSSGIASGSSGSGAVASSVVHADIVCDGVVTAVDCVEAEIGQRRVGASSASFDCYSVGGRVVAQLSQPFVGEAASWPSGFAEIKATCAGSPAERFDHELRVSNGTQGSIRLTSYETGVFMEGTFSDPSGTFSGSFTIRHEGP